MLDYKKCGNPYYLTALFTLAQAACGCYIIHVRWTSHGGPICGGDQLTDYQREKFGSQLPIEDGDFLKGIAIFWVTAFSLTGFAILLYVINYWLPFKYWCKDYEL